MPIHRHTESGTIHAGRNLRGHLVQPLPCLRQESRERERVESLPKVSWLPWFLQGCFPSHLADLKTVTENFRDTRTHTDSHTHMHMCAHGHMFTDLSATLLVDGASVSSRYYSRVELISISCLQPRNVNSVVEIYPNTWMYLPWWPTSPYGWQMGGRRITINVTRLPGWLSSQWKDRSREMQLQRERVAHSSHILSLFRSELKCSRWLEGDPKGNASLPSTS